MKPSRSVALLALSASGLLASSVHALTLNYSGTSDTVAFGPGFDTNCSSASNSKFDICHEDLLTASGSFALTFNNQGDVAGPILLGRIRDQEDAVATNETNGLSMSIGFTLADGSSHAFAFAPTAVASTSTNTISFSSPLTYGSSYTFSSDGFDWTIAGRIEWSGASASSTCPSNGGNWDTSTPDSTSGPMSNGNYTCYRARFQLTDKTATVVRNPVGVPEPGSLALLGLGLVGIATLGRRRGR